MPQPATSKATQDFVPIKEIRDGIVILKDGGLRLVLAASSINFALKSADEQMAILLQYQDFLNSLDFPVQTMIQSRRLDIAPYLTTLEKGLKEQVNDLIKIQTREYIEFIKNFTESHNIMSKSFFIVIPYEVAIIKSSGLLRGLFGGDKENQAAANLKQFQEHRTQLEQRAQVVEQGLARSGIRVAQLGTEELVELYYKIFNPGEKTVPSLAGLRA